ncbi:MAG: type II secretion system GspH family protein [Oscillospiraceae bacterium]|nr:type II secretion system GspH family protein [Oscillospiraceae bacterium]
MIKYLQGLKRKKGFTLVELIVVIAILAVMTTVILLNIDNRRTRIKTANTNASNFYVAIQSAFTRYMTYPGQLSPVFRDNPATPYMKYYKGANGNYPYDAATAGTPIPITNDNYPSPCTLCVEVKVEGNKVVYVNCENGSVTNVVAKPDSDDGSEFGRLLKMEIEKRVEYQNGYYYAKISCNPKYNSMTNQIEKMDTVIVDYAAFSYDRLSGSDTSNYTFSSNDNILLNGEICGTAAPSTDRNGNSIAKIGVAETSLL